jgi:hypothetical protein
LDVWLQQEWLSDHGYNPDEVVEVRISDINGRFDLTTEALAVITKYSIYEGQGFTHLDPKTDEIRTAVSLTRTAMDSLPSIMSVQYLFDEIDNIEVDASLDGVALL